MGCLVDAVQFDMRNGSAVQKISSACRAELKFELLQKHANLRLNTAVVSPLHTLEARSDIVF